MVVFLRCLRLYLELALALQVELTERLWVVWARQNTLQHLKVLVRNASFTLTEAITAFLLVERSICRAYF